MSSPHSNVRFVGSTRFYQVLTFVLGVALVVSAFFVCFPTFQPSVAGEFYDLGVSISPEGSVKLGVGVSQNFSATVTGGQYPYTFTWTSQVHYQNGTVGEILLLKEDVVTQWWIDKYFDPNQKPVSSWCFNGFPFAMEDYFVVMVNVVDGVGGSQGVMTYVFDPYTSPTQYLNGANSATYSYKIETDGLGWYRAKNGSDGSIIDAWTSLNGTTPLQNANDAIKATGLGGIIKIGVGTFSVVNLTLSSKVSLIGSGIGVTILRLPDDTLPDGLNETWSSTNPYPVIGFDDYCKYSTISELSIDGNEVNNRGWYSSSVNDALGADGILLAAYSMLPSAVRENDIAKAPSYITINKIHIYNTVRSSLDMWCSYVTVTNSIFENATADHHMYIAYGAHDNFMDNNVFKGSAYFYSVLFAGNTNGLTGAAYNNNLLHSTFVNFTRAEYGTILGQIWFPYGAIYARNMTYAHDNVVRGAYILETADTLGTKISINEPKFTLEDIFYDSKAPTNTGSPISDVIEIKVPTDISYSGSLVRNVNVNFTQAPANTNVAAVIGVYGSGVTLEKINIDELSSSIFKGIVISSVNNAVDSVSVDHARINVGGYGIGYVGVANGGITNLYLGDDITIVNSTGGTLVRSGTVTYLHVPTQRVLRQNTANTTATTFDMLTNLPAAPTRVEANFDYTTRNIADFKWGYSNINATAIRFTVSGTGLPATMYCAAEFILLRYNLP